MQAGLAVVDGVDEVALTLEQADQHPGEVLLVLDDEYPVGHGQPPAVAVMASLWTLRRSTEALAPAVHDRGGCWELPEPLLHRDTRQGGWAS